jgi:hypothetical protein
MEKCPAYGQKCQSCGKNNHFSTVCKHAGTSKRNRVLAMENASADSESSKDVLCFTLGPKSESINVVQEKSTDPNAALFINMLVNKKSDRFQLDCGARWNVNPAKYQEYSDVTGEVHT